MTYRSISEKTYKKLCEVIPGGVNSPVRSFPGLKQTPLVVESGQGDMLYDVDGNSYIDFCGSWGALIHGHAHPSVTKVVQEKVVQGTTFGITTASEEKLARLIVNLLPSIEKIRFVSSGTEATMSALRLARGFTGRDMIIKFSGNYHGHVDALLVQAGSGVMRLATSATSAGIPQKVIEDTLCLPFNDIDSCYRCLKDDHLKKRIAAVILEPIAANMGVIPAQPAFLHMLREETQKIGALLIFDEVITGFG